MISLAINILITLIGMTLIIVGIYNYLPKIEKLLAEKLNLSLFRGSEDYGPLAEVFHKYNHRDSGAWCDWLVTQDAKTQEEAINKLIGHIDTNPASWGSITPEAIVALGTIGNREHTTIMKTTLSTARKSWKKFKTCEACYEASCRGLVELNEESARTIINEELDEKTSSNDEKTMCIVNALEAFSENSDINPLLTKILTDTKISYKARNHCITAVQTWSTDRSEAFADAINTFVNELDGPYTSDDLKIFEALLNLAIKEIDDQTFDIILAACTSDKLSNTAIKTMELILKSSYEEFSPQQIYMLVNLEKDETNLLAHAMASVFNLSPAEKELIKYFDVQKEFPFKKAPVTDENISQAKAIEVPKCLEELFEDVKNLLKDRAMKKQNGAPGGILLTGYTDQEKLFLCRAAAADKRWSFVYATYEDIVTSGANVKTLLDSISSNKPCIVYFDEVTGLIRSPDASFSKNLKQFASDPMIFLVATIKDEADVNEDGCSVMIVGDEELENVFPQAMDISYCSDAYKNKVLAAKTALLEPNREHENLDQYDILGPSKDMSPLEFEKYLVKYFRASLLLHGKLVSSSDFEKIDSLNFEGRGSL